MEPLTRERTADLVTLVAGVVFAALLGFVVGVVLTFTHGVLAPWGLVAGLAIVGCFVLGMRLAVGRLLAFGALAGVLVAIIVFAFPGPGGSVVLDDSVVSEVWAAGPAVLGLAILLWPASRRRPAHDRGVTRRPEDPSADL